jgi:hypothetical protein
MDYQVLFNIAVGIAACFGGWTLRSITSSLERLDSDVRKMPLTYVTKEDFKDDIDEIKSLLREIFNKLDKKQDKL